MLMFLLDLDYEIIQVVCSVWVCFLNLKYWVCFLKRVLLLDLFPGTILFLPLSREILTCDIRH